MFADGNSAGKTEIVRRKRQRIQDLEKVRGDRIQSRSGRGENE